MAKKKKATSKKTSKKTVKKTKKASKKASKKISKKSSPSRGSSSGGSFGRFSSRSKKKVSLGSYSSSFPSSLSQENSFPGSTYKAYGLDRREARFTGRRLGILVLALVVVIILAIWGTSSGGDEIGDLSEPDEAQELQPLDNTEQGEGIGTEGEQQSGSGQEPVQDSAPAASTEQLGESPPSTPSEQASNTYIVQTGDNLSKIARKTLGDPARYKEIMDLNGITSPSQIKVGQELKIPAKQQ